MNDHWLLSHIFCPQFMQLTIHSFWICTTSHFASTWVAQQSCCHGDEALLPASGVPTGWDSHGDQLYLVNVTFQMLIYPPPLFSATSIHTLKGQSSNFEFFSRNNTSECLCWRLSKWMCWPSMSLTYYIPYTIHVYAQSTNHISLKKIGLDFMKVTHCVGCILANAIYMPHQLHWGDREMGTAISCTECSQVAGLIHTAGHKLNMAMICLAVR